LCSRFISSSSKYWYYLVSLLYDFILNIIMFPFIMFLVCSSSTFDMVVIDNKFMYKFEKHLAFFARELSGRSYVGMVL